MITRTFTYESSSYVFGDGEHCSLLTVEVDVTAYAMNDVNFEISVTDIDGNSVKAGLVSKAELADIYDRAYEVAMEHADEAYTEFRSARNYYDS